MPAPAIYVVAVIGGVAAAIAFKEFVYEPHLAPKIERWAENFIAKRKMRRRLRQGAVAVQLQPGAGDTGRKGRAIRGLNGKRSDAGDDDGSGDDRSSIELERLVAKEVNEWRTGVDQSQASLRRRKNLSQASNALEESNASLPFSPITPTHVIIGTSVSSTASSGSPTPAAPSPAPGLSRLPNLTVLSSKSLPTPSQRLPTPAPSSQGGSPPFSPVIVAASPTSSMHESVGPAESTFIVPSVPHSPLESVSDLELLSGSPPRAGSLSVPLSRTMSGVMSPSNRQFSDLELLSASEDDLESFSVHSNASMDGSSAYDDDFDVRSSHEEGSEASSWASVRSH